MSRNRLVELKDQATEVARKVGDQITDQANALRDATTTARYTTEDLIETNPWPAVTIAAAVGFLVGFIVAKRTS